MRGLAQVALLALVAGCGDPVAGSTQTGGTCPIPKALGAPSFRGDILPAIQASCGSSASSCHGTTIPAGHVRYGTDALWTAADVWSNLVNATPASAPAGYLRIKPNDPGHSWLIEKITQDQPGGSGYGARMPYGGADVCQPTVDTLVTWIDQGAQDN